jgi:hypothetical protein
MSTIPLYRTVPARLLMLLALGVPYTASAGKMVIAPLIADATINAKQRLAVHQLIASELDFAPEVNGVVDLDVAPPNLDDACIAAAKCLGGIATANGGEQMISGKLSSGGETYLLDLVFYDGTTIARRKQFTVPQDPTALANAMTPIVRELLTGAGAQEKAAATATKSDFDDEEDLSVGVAGMAMGDGLVDVADEEPMAPAPAPVVAAKKPTAPPAPVPTGKKASKDDQRRLAAASAATGLAAGLAAGAAGGAAGAAPKAAPTPAAAPPAAPIAAAAAAPPAPADEDLAKMISFGGSVNDITAEDISMINFGAPPGLATAAATPAPVVVERPAPSAGGTSDTRLAEEEAELDKLTDLDGGGSKAARTASPGGGSGPKTPSKGGMGELGHVVQFTVRGGYSKYYDFDFFTGGGEAGVAVAQGLHLVAGVELYAVERVLPTDLQLETGIYSQWNFIFPANLGAIYKFPLGMAQPYVGADTIFVQYYKDEIGSDWAVGARVRAGVDLMLIPNFGFNLNLAAGGWSGQNWGLIEYGVKKAGFLPQVSAGTVLAF